MGDVFRFKGTPGSNELAPAPHGAPCGTPTGDENNRGLVLPGGGQPGDDLISFDTDTLRMNPANMGPPPFPVFFTLEPGSPALGALGVSPGDILAIGGPFGPVPVVYISEGALGIPAGSNVNAMALKVIPPTLFDGIPALDEILFSVDRASATGFAVDDGNLVVSGGTILHYDGTRTIVAHDHNDVGLDDLDDLDDLDALGTMKVQNFFVEAVPLVPFGNVGVVPSGSGVEVTTPGEDEDEGVGFEFYPSVRFSLDLSWPAASAPESMQILALGGQEGEEITRLGFERPSAQKDLLLPAVQFLLPDWDANTYDLAAVEVWRDGRRQGIIAVELDAGRKSNKMGYPILLVDGALSYEPPPGFQGDFDFTCAMGFSKAPNGQPTANWICSFEQAGVFRLGEHSISGDLIRFRMRALASAAIEYATCRGALVMASTSTFGIQGFSNTPGSTVNGVPLLAEGQATTQAFADGLQVNNIGDSGRDGVSVNT